MSCPEFTVVHNTGICKLSTDSYIPSLDVMGRLCFKDRYHECTHFRNCISESNRRIEGSKLQLRGESFVCK